ncbi:hypothetical protein [Pseudomonas fluorescens]|uniref:hypothetical protein n=1 Tax=Pseudomonas fluorescens TaxID=294 RepID=UPI001655ABFD|nr:hypothetical protein [Pseudomonas fluorescens]MBC8786557.1 hypothetical protein [Pseudomonas fluorescens]
MSKDNSGPAFPCTPEHSVRMNGEGGSGMSLRDYFAGQFMAGRAALPGQPDHKLDAAEAYKAADAMLAARSA